MMERLKFCKLRHTRLAQDNSGVVAVIVAISLPVTNAVAVATNAAADSAQRCVEVDSNCNK